MQLWIKRIHRIEDALLVLLLSIMILLAATQILLRNFFDLVFHPQFIIVGSACNHDHAFPPLFCHFNAKTLMGHEKGYETPDDHHYKP